MRLVRIQPWVHFHAFVTLGIPAMACLVIDDDECDLGTDNCEHECVLVRIRRVHFHVLVTLGIPAMACLVLMMTNADLGTG